jgi:hypothetical protein
MPFAARRQHLNNPEALTTINKHLQGRPKDQPGQSEPPTTKASQSPGRQTHLEKEVD